MGGELSVVFDVQNNKTELLWKIMNELRPGYSAIMAEMLQDYNRRDFSENPRNVVASDPLVSEKVTQPKLNWSTFVDRNNQFVRTEELTEAHACPLFVHAVLSAFPWYLELGSSPLPDAPVMARLSLPYYMRFFWDETLHYRSLGRRVAHEFARILGATKAIFFEVPNFDPENTAYGIYVHEEIMPSEDYNYETHTFHGYTPSCSIDYFLSRLETLGPPLDLNTIYTDLDAFIRSRGFDPAENDEKRFAAYFVETLKF
jgi:hypothetical protein